MTPELSQFIVAAGGIFAGTIPLLGVIGWAAYTQDKRLSRIKANMDDLGKDLKALGIRTSGLETRVSVIESDINCPRVAPVPR